MAKREKGWDPEHEQPGDPTLHPDLQKIRDRVGPAGYGLATARLFRPGGRFNPRPRRQRYAIT